MTLNITLAKDAPDDVAVHATGISTAAVAEHAQAAFLTAAGFTGALGTTVFVPADNGGPVGLAVGVGDAPGADDLRRAAAAVARAVTKQTSVAVDLLRGLAEGTKPADAAQAVAEGVVLGGYQYLAQKSSPQPSSLADVTVVGGGGKPVQAAIDRGVAVAEATCVARDLVNEPGGSLVPDAFAKRAVALGQQYGFEVEVLDEKAIKAAKMGGLLGVNRGSDLPPRFLELRWAPESKPRGVVALVGKGITFDSGGLSLKPSDAMMGMKGDMGGGAAVLGAFCALSAVAPRVEVRGYVPLTDNMTGGDATRLGDVLTISNGTTVEIHNTDAEGRLILADALARASDGGPDAIIDLATLTGACMVALGANIAGVMGTSDGLLQQVQTAAASAGEPVWPLPLPEDLRSELDSEVADLKNVGSRNGGASIAGLFLKEFVGDGIPWVHLDIAGPAFAEKQGPLSRAGGTGFGVRTLVKVVSGFSKVR